MQKRNKKIIGWSWIKKHWPISRKNSKSMVRTSRGLLVNSPSFLYVYWKNALNCWTREYQKMFKLLLMPYDIEAQKVGILSLIVDQSHSIIKKCISKV
jgi:hypothetical protein